MHYKKQVLNEQSIYQEKGRVAQPVVAPRREGIKGGDEAPSDFDNALPQKGDLDDAWEISAFLTYFQENHTVVLGNWIFLKNTSRYTVIN